MSYTKFEKETNMLLVYSTVYLPTIYKNQGIIIKVWKKFNIWFLSGIGFKTTLFKESFYAFHILKIMGWLGIRWYFYNRKHIF